MGDDGEILAVAGSLGDERLSMGKQVLVVHDGSFGFGA
jgi:hypothetical protein